MTPTPVTPKSDEPIKVTVKRNVFDLDRFERRTITSPEIELKSVKSMDEALNVAAEGDEEKMVAIFNKGYRRQQINEAKSELMSDNFVSPKAVSGWINQFKAVYPLKADTPEGRKAQQDQIGAYIRSQPVLLETIKMTAKAVAAQELEDEDNDSSEESE